MTAPTIRMLAVTAVTVPAWMLVTRDRTRVRQYLAAELLATLGLEYVAQRHAASYFAAYLMLRPMNFVTALRVARPDVFPWLAGALFGLAAYAFSDASGYATTQAVETALYVVAGWAAVKSHPVLSLCWLLMALFCFGFALGWETPKWAALNQWLQCSILCVCFVLLPILEREDDTLCPVC